MAARGIGRTVHAPNRSTRHKYLMSWKLTILDLISQLIMLLMMKRLVRTQRMMIMLMTNTWMWWDTRVMLVALDSGRKS